ncbi:MAG TPA: hypothetical protein VD973_06220 [Symbiobacteriaceae bacterium]|nr:hypothetical protein [Symbiobacteriaceae bacterium]
MHITISIVTGVVLLLLSFWLLARSHKQYGSMVRSFGFGAFAMAMAALFYYSRMAGAPLWFTPFFGLSGVVLLGLMIHFFRLMRRLSYGQWRPDLLDTIADGIISQFVKQ